MEEIISNIKKQILSDGYTQEEAETVKVYQVPGENFMRFSFGKSSKIFIRQVLIVQLEQVVKTSPWLSFVLIGSGIEFLGKCIDSEYPESWDERGRSGDNFKDAIRQLNGLKKYAFLLDRQRFNLYDMFRCGLTHGLAPKNGISLSSGLSESPNLHETNGVVNLHINSLFEDFKMACEEVISRTYAEPNKMNGNRMYINGTYSVPIATTFTSSFEVKK